MPVVIPAAAVAVVLALMALLFIWGSSAAVKAMAGWLPGKKGIGPVSINIRGWVEAAAAGAEAIAMWAIGDLVRPVINMVLGPVYALWNFADSVWILAETVADNWRWLLNQALPRIISRVEAYAHTLYLQARTYAHSLYLDAESYAHRLYLDARSYALTIVRSAEALAVREVNAAKTLLINRMAVIRKDVENEFRKADNAIKSLIASDVAALKRSIATVSGEVAKVGGISAASVKTEIAAGVKAAESSAASLDKTAAAALERAAVAGIGALWPAITTDVGALESAIGAGWGDIGTLVKDLDLTKPIDIAGSLAFTGLATDVLFRYLRECGLPNCRNLSGLGNFLEDLLGIGSLAALLAMLAEIISNPEQAAQDAVSDLTGPLSDAQSLVSSLLGYLMAGFGDFIGKAGSSAEQLFVWQVLGQLISALALPFTNALTQEVLSKDPNVPLSPDQAADLVARGFMAMSDGQTWAGKSGIAPSVLAEMVKGRQSAPDLSSVFEAYRRGIIGDGQDDPTDVSANGALAYYAIQEAWRPVVKQLAVQIPTVAEVMNAWLEGQITEDEARTRYLAAGGDPTWFQTSYNANGQAPTPMEALEMLNRGIIQSEGSGPSSTSYHQAFLEGPWRDKWETPFRGLARYLPPPRTVTAMYHSGQIDHAKAAQYLAWQGLEQDDITSYLAPASTNAAATAKHLTQSQLVDLYKDGAASATDTEAALKALGYNAHDAAQLVTLATVSVQAAQYKAATGRIRSQYEAGKMTRADVRTALIQLKVPTDQIPALIDTWDIAAATVTKQLSAAQLAAAVYYSEITPQYAIQRLQALGYDETDAWLVVAIRLHGGDFGVSRPAGLPAPQMPPKPAAPAAGSGSVPGGGPERSLGDDDEQTVDHVGACAGGHRQAHSGQ